MIDPPRSPVGPPVRLLGSADECPGLVLGSVRTPLPTASLRRDALTQLLSARTPSFRVGIGNPSPASVAKIRRNL